MELLSRHNSFLIIDCAILSQAAKITVVQDAWNY